MILYYAIGDGFGHLTRARAALHTLGFEREAAILTASDARTTELVCRDEPIIRVPRSLENNRTRYRAWLRELLAELRPSKIFLDAFPAGICGEFCDFAELGSAETHYVARLLKWKEYEIVLNERAPRFFKTHLLEPLEAMHAQFAAAHSEQVAPLVLRDPPVMISKEIETLIDEIKSESRPFWLVVHSGASEEISQLLAYAAEMRRVERQDDTQIILIAPHAPSQIPDDVRCVNFYPAAPLFPFAARIITACGFNAMRQAAAYAEKHFFIPFPRRFDDQFARAASARRRLNAITA